MKHWSDSEFYSLDCLEAVPCPPYGYGTVEQEETEENTMYAKIDTTVGNPNAQAQDYLLERLNGLTNTKTQSIRPLYKMDDDESPKTPAEAAQRIKDGKFTWSKKVNADGTWKDEHDYHYEPLRYIQWRMEPADTKGFADHCDRIDAERTKVMDVIKVLTPAEGLAALLAFESATIN